MVGSLWPRRLISTVAQRLLKPRWLSPLGGFPDRAFGRFAIAQQNVDALAGIRKLGVQGDARGGRKTLAERAGGHVHEGQARRGMALEIGIDAAQRQQPLARKEARLRPRRRRGSGAAWPFERTNTSFAGLRGSRGS